MFRFFPLILALSLVGCGALEKNPLPEDPAGTLATKSSDNYVMHRVSQRGETLGSISHWYTGERANWPKLLEATPWLNNETIHLGDIVLIPKHLAVTHSPPVENLEPSLKRIHQEAMQPRTKEQKEGPREKAGSHLLELLKDL